jgi:hypothetical protein
MSKDKDGNEQTFSRSAAESLIAQSFYPHVFASANTVSSLYRNNEIPTTLTDTERTALHKYTYFGWTVAVVSGFGVFATLFGGLRFGSYVLRRRRPSLQLSQPTYHTEMAQKRARFSHLDNPTASTSKSKPTFGGTPSPAQPVEQHPPPAGNAVSDTAVHVQFLLCSAMSLLAALAMGNKYSGSDIAFPEKLAELPLQTGTSIWCERYLCPAVLQHHRNLLTGPITYEKLYDSILEDKLKKFRQQAINAPAVAADDAGSADETGGGGGHTVFPFQAEQMKMWQTFDRDPSVPTPNEVYESAKTDTAETVLMETLQRLVYHCECRQAFAQDCRRTTAHPALIDPHTDLVKVPESGVPLRFLDANKEN